MQENLVYHRDVIILQTSEEEVGLTTNNVDVINFSDEMMNHIKIKTTVCQMNRKHRQKKQQH